MSAYRPVLAENGLHDIQGGMGSGGARFDFKNYQFLLTFWKAIHIMMQGQSKSTDQNNLCKKRFFDIIGLNFLSFMFLNFSV